MAVAEVICYSSTAPVDLSQSQETDERQWTHQACFAGLQDSPQWMGGGQEERVEERWTGERDGFVVTCDLVTSFDWSVENFTACAGVAVV